MVLKHSTHTDPSRLNKILLAVIAAVGLIMVSTAAIADDYSSWPEPVTRVKLVPNEMTGTAAPSDLIRREAIYSDWTPFSGMSPAGRKSAHWMSSAAEESVMPAAPDEWDAVLVANLSIQRQQQARPARHGKLARRLHKAMKRNERQERRAILSDRHGGHAKEIASHPDRSGKAPARGWFERETRAGGFDQDPGTAEWKRLIRMNRVHGTDPEWTE